jgi:acyl-CoA thioester hydrolase
MRFDLPEAKKLTLEMVIPIRWGDMDAMGHVNNTAYFRYMEQARIEWAYEHLAGEFEARRGSVIANASCNYLIPLVYPKTIEVRMFLAHPGRSSVTSYYDIVAGDTTYAEGAAKIVWMDFATGRPTPLPEIVVAPLRALTSQPA